MHIDIETVRLITLVNELAELSTLGCHPFSTATENTRGLIYDDTTLINGMHPLICDYLINPEHHDIISTYTDNYVESNITLGVLYDTEGFAYAAVQSNDGSNLFIVIDSGKWYLA